MEEADRERAPDPSQPAARATLFGGFQLYAVDGRTIEISNRRARAILAMLCMDIGQPIDREHLSKLLWPGRFEAHARASLRQCLLDLGKLLAPLRADVLDVSRNRIALHPGSIRTDLEELEDDLARGDYEAAAGQLAAVGANPILDRMDFGDAFNLWLAARSGDAEKRLRVAVMEALAALERKGDEDARSRLADAWSVRDPGVGSVAAPTVPAGRTRIAVLPFRLINAREGQDYFADGLAEELITALGRVPQLLVAGRTSSFHFRDSALALPEISAALRVSHLIEGSVQRQGEQVRIHVHLIDGASGFESWGQRFDGTLDNIFALQENVAQAVTAAIGGKLGIAMQVPVVRGMTHSKQAYDLYLRGRSLCSRVIGDGVLDKGIALLEQALEIDPAFAECWVVLAEAHQMVAVYTQCTDRPAAVRRMAECARKATVLSPALGYPRSLLGVDRWTQGDIVGALDLTFEGHRLEPENPATTMRLAWMLMYCGRTADAAPLVEAAVDQDPVDGRKYALVWALHMARGDLHAARDTGQHIVDLAFPSVYLAFTSAALGEHELAVEQYQLTKRLVNTVIMPPVGTGAMTREAMDAYWLMAAKGVCSGNESDRQAYWQLLEVMYATLPDKGDLAITGPAILTGNAELTFKALGQHGSAASMLALLPLWTRCEPICQIWQHPEFIPFAQRIGMAAAWDKYGWPDLLPPPSNRLE